MVVIDESDMQFGEYPECDFFHIENSSFYRERCKPKGVKTCEFIIIKRNTIYFVEAKRTSPCQICVTPQNSNQYVEEIVQKMRDSLSMYTSILLKCNDPNLIPQKLQVHDFSKIKICFLLVIKTINNSSLQPLKDKFDKEFRKDFQIWKGLQFFVFDEDRARKHSFVI